MTVSVTTKKTAESPRNHLRDAKVLNVFYAAGMALGGVTSYYSHMSVTSLSREVDRFGIWCIFVPASGFMLLRFCNYPKSRRWAVKFIAGSLLGISAGAVIHFGFGKEAFTTPLLFTGVLILVVVISCTVPLRLALQKWAPINSRFHLQPLESNLVYAGCAFVAAVVAFLCQDPSRLGIACDGDSPWYQNTHGFWHILMAVALFFLWLFVWKGDYKDIMDTAKSYGGVPLHKASL